MANQAIGVDIGSRTITVAELKGARGRTTISNFGGLELPGDAVREGEIIDVPGTAAAIKELMGSAGIKGKKVWLGVANQRVVVRQVDLPWVEEKEVKASLRYQVQDFIPIPVEEAELDVHVVDEFVNDQGERFRRMLLVAAHRDSVNAHVEAARQAGLKPVGVDLNSFAVLRAVGNTQGMQPGDEVLVDIGADVTNIIVHRGGQPTFVRILVMGGDDITDALESGLDVSREDAEAAKRATLVGAEGDVTSRIVTERADSFIDEIRSSLDYFQAQTGDVQLASVILTGGGASLQGLADRLAEQLRLPVDVGNPFPRLSVQNSVYSEQDLAMIGPSMTTAIGLGMGGLE
jgi:type IV pilus assembly protein PilM